MLITQNHPATDEEHHRSTEREYWAKQLRLNTLLVYITGVGVIGGVISVLFLKCTLDATWETLRISERAYVGVDQIEIRPKQRVIILSLRNTGKVPAQWVRGKIHAACLIPDETIGSSRTDFSTGRAIISPGPSTYRVALRLEKFREEEEFCTRTHNERLAVAGYISYQDGFGNRETVPYCFEYQPFLPSQWLTCPTGTREDIMKERRSMQEEEKNNTQKKE